MSRTEGEEFDAVVRLSRAVLILCDGEAVAVAGVAVLCAAIALRQMDTGGNRNHAIELLRSQLAGMKDELEPGAVS